MKSLVYIFIILISFLGYSQDKELPWRKDFKLSYTDFEGKPDPNHPYAAVTYSGMSYGFSAQVVNDKVEVNYSVNCFFVANLSWMKMDLADEKLLKHEQLHFDITELFARKFRKELKETKFTKEVKKQIQDLYNKYQTAKVAYQEKYDQETDHSKIENKQLEWQVKVQKELDQLETFSSK